MAPSVAGLNGPNCNEFRDLNCLLTYLLLRLIIDGDAAAARNAFNAFDKKSEERIKVGDIEATMKKLGHNIKSGWLEKIESTIDTEGLLPSGLLP